MHPSRPHGRRHPLRCALVALLALAPLACGRSTATVSGEVSLDGKPLPAGQISFVPAGGPAVSAPIKGGAYTAEGVPTGDVQVTVETDSIKRQLSMLQNPTAPGKTDPSVGGPPPGSEAAKKLPPEAKEFFEKQQKLAAESARSAKELAESYRPLPDRYKDPAKSGFSLTVQSGTNKYDVPLKSK